ncbi:MAG: hypothetical protein R3C49_27485, partial [Planctomycetaceae bacterium]
MTCSALSAEDERLTTHAAFHMQRRPRGAVSGHSFTRIDAIDAFSTKTFVTLIQLSHQSIEAFRCHKCQMRHVPQEQLIRIRPDRSSLARGIRSACHPPIPFDDAFQDRVPDETP